MPLTAESERFIKGATYGTGPDHFRMDGNVEWLRAQLVAIEAAARADTDALRARVEEFRRRTHIMFGSHIDGTPRHDSGCAVCEAWDAALAAPPVSPAPNSHQTPENTKP